MTGLRPADARFLLPRPAASLWVTTRAGGWSGAARAAGLENVATKARVLVADADSVTADLQSGTAEAVIALGKGRPERSKPDWAWMRVLMRPGPTGARLFVPAGDSAVARYVFGYWSHPNDAWRMARSAVVAAALGRGLVPSTARVTVGAAESGPPFLIAAARGFDLPASPGWFCALGDGDDYQRGAFHVFPTVSSDDDAAMPRWIVKFSRIAGDDGPFVAEGRARAMLDERAPRAARQAPRILGRCDVGVPAVVETAAPGPPLSSVLDGPEDLSLKLRLINEMVSWIEELGLESRGPVAEMAPEWARLDQTITPRWVGARRCLDLLKLLPAMSPVLAHHDLGSWNAVATPHGVMVLDWESARYPAMPLWDLLYFLTDALVALAGPASVTTKVTRALGLLRGDLPESTMLFTYMRAAADRFAVPPEAIGPLATVAWLHHGSSPSVRRARAETSTGAPVDEVGKGLLTRIAEPWLTDPALGPTWSALSR